MYKTAVCPPLSNPQSYPPSFNMPTGSLTSTASGSTRPPCPIVLKVFLTPHALSSESWSLPPALKNSMNCTSGGFEVVIQKVQLAFWQSTFFSMVNAKHTLCVLQSTHINNLTSPLPLNTYLRLGQKNKGNTDIICSHLFSDQKQWVQALVDQETYFFVGPPIIHFTVCLTV
jgi:hypothetical protein